MPTAGPRKHRAWARGARLGMPGFVSGYRGGVGKPKVFVCKKCKRHQCVEDALVKAEAKTILVGCQKICSGPVAGLCVDGQMEWFDRLDTGKRLAGLRLLANHPTARPVKALRRRRVSKRSGRPVR